MIDTGSIITWVSQNTGALGLHQSRLFREGRDYFLEARNYTFMISQVNTFLHAGIHLDTSLKLNIVEGNSLSGTHKAMKVCKYVHIYTYVLMHMYVYVYVCVCF
jgi:hypothetical protein